MKNSHIEWCDHTFNPWIGCTKVSEGCANCYAEERDKRFADGKHWGPGALRQRTSAANWKQPLQWECLAGMGHFRQCAICDRREFRKWDATLPPGGLACCSTEGCLALPETESFRVRPRVFCASLADWLDQEVPIEWLVDLLDLIRQSPHLDWLLLTKRPQNWNERINQALSANLNAWGNEPNDLADWMDGWRYKGESPANVWIGTTVENQKQAESRIPYLLHIPARVRFLSCEPLLGHVILPYSTRWMATRQIEWVICGGESGRGARPMHPDWALSLRDQCQHAGVPFLFKQWGEFSASGQRLGKHATGRLLNGREHNAFPEVA